MKYRIFDTTSENVDHLFALFEATYGDSVDYKNRWQWEYEEHPDKEHFKVFVAESGGSLVGATTRLPVFLTVRGQSLRAAFNCNSMVHPDYRRKGIMEKLYTQSASVIPVLLSKGTMPAMYRLLKRMGFTDVEPNNFMVALISPFRWLFWRLGLYRPVPAFQAISLEEDMEFRDVVRYDVTFDQFFENISCQYDTLISKDADYMNWRYVNNTLKEYKTIQRVVAGRIVSSVVLAASGSHLRIVDLLFDSTEANEPERTLRFVRDYARKCGFLKLICWTTDKDLRRTLKKHWFWSRKETPQFTMFSLKYSPEEIMSGRVAFFEGDGDAEYL